MKTFVSLLLVLGPFVLHGNASVARMLVKKGATVPISLSANERIKRTVAAGVQYFHVNGEHAGKFVTENGTALDSHNYDFADGTLIIKKFSDADVGSYQKEPNVIVKKNDDGRMTAFAGTVLMVEMGQD